MNERFESMDAVLKFAIEKEEEAAAFYRELSHQTWRIGMREVFEEFAREEDHHKAKLLTVKQGLSLKPASKKVADLKIADYLADVEPSPELDYRGVLVVAMKREAAAFRLYTDLAARAESPEYKTLFEGLAQEEAKHKLRFETEYDDCILTDN